MEYIERKKSIEVLAPAGSYESLLAAVYAGADAVYVGGSRFGARAYADNFDTGQLMAAIDFVHLHGRKIYLAVNTLLKEKELSEELYDYLEPLYRQGLDAVIVQDTGVLAYIREQFPDLPVHASTQMTITDADGVRFLEQQGVSRVVLARELNLDEISAITGQVKAEIECFVHGALCYCYSGQCLYSSLIGGRSGNRGQCAQPCRLPYHVVRNISHIMSLKDICTLKDIPALIEAGITSFKIEGRMKKPEYVAAVTSMYRKYVDLYLGTAEKKYKVEQQDIDMLLDVYNRGGFHPGYLHQYNGSDMLADQRPNHAGIPAVQVEPNGRVRALREINPGDVIEMPGERPDYTFGQTLSPGKTILIPQLRKKMVKPGTILNRMHNAQLLSALRERYVTGQMKEKINGDLIISANESAKLRLCCGETAVSIEGGIIQTALSQPTDESRIRKQLVKTGNTPFEFESLNISVDGQIFVPIQELNDIRRRGMEALETEIVHKFRREITERTLFSPEKKQSAIADAGMKFHVSVETPEQFKMVCSREEVKRIYLDSSASNHPYADKAHEAGKEVFLAMPHIFRQKDRQFWDYRWGKKAGLFDGILVRNFESFYYLKEQGYTKPIVTDYNLYIFNRQAGEFWQHNGVQGMTAPLELNWRELQQLDLSSCEMVVYGYLPMMITAGCIRKNSGRCGRISGASYIMDRYRKEFMVKNDCNYCYNVIYNTLPLSLADQHEALNRLRPQALRLMFTRERPDAAAAALDSFCDPEVAGRKWTADREFTRGHFKRGIK